ncbi:MAG: tRNA uridine-5-carboxymethylaminomethyl(34) synthesis GTPase MnmE [Candidatus Eremiobacteraeota bacterium]|nr:tRNA uridine-5-carboxymethylaminomethyl(34) synthesis GTPase MnmE [Candidatus Eremiobacteraeota bacterium]
MAIATPPGEGGVAIVRLSGPLAPVILKRLHGRVRTRWESHKLYYGPIVQADGLVLDQGLVTWMKAPHSYTGEEIAELHLHGGQALAQLVVQNCLVHGARLADPGEFTMRAFLNGKLDLTQAEAVQQLIQSRSQIAAQLASRNLTGYFSTQVEEVRKDLLHWLSMLEAEIDFGDEVPGLPLEQSLQRWGRALEAVERLLQQGQSGKILADGLRTVIIGAPNAGKSTLMNQLLGRARALVTDIAGTTRDTLEEPLVVAGISLLLVDTAGLRRDSQDRVELLGIERSRQEAEQADLILWVVDGHQSEAPDPEFYQMVFDRPHLLILNKRDLGLAPWTADDQGRPIGLPVSLLEGTGSILYQVEQLVRELVGEQSDVMRLTHRQWETLLRARESLQRLGETLEANMSAEFLALDLRSAVQALGQIQGLDVTEEILDRIFSTFCLGK